MLEHLNVFNTLRLFKMKSSSTVCSRNTSWKRLLLVVVLCLQQCVQSTPSAEVTIGAIFSSNYEDAVCIKAFELAVEYVNNNTAILPSTQLKYIINYTNTLDPLANVQKACYQISNGVPAIFGPITSTDVKAVSTITSSLKVPIYSPAATNPAFSSDHTNFPFLLRMSPPDFVSTQAIADLFKKFLWKRFAILSSNTDFATGLINEFHSIALGEKWTVATTQKFEAVKNYVNVNVRDKLRRIEEKGVRVVLLNCIGSYVPTIMKQAKELDMIQGWAWVAMDVGLNTTSPIPQEIIGLLGIQPVADQGSLYSVLTSKLTAAGYNEDLLPYGAVNRFDSVLAFAKGLHDYFQAGQSLSNNRPTCGSCQGDSTSKINGEILMNYLKQVQTNGASHFLNFSNDGSPGISTFEVMNLQSKGWIKVGNWDGSRGLSLDASNRLITWPGLTTDIPVDTRYLFGNRTIKILALLEGAFIQLKSNNASSGSDRYEGLCIDLLKRLSKDMNFKYTIDIVADGQYGVYNPTTKKWNGLVRELIDQNYDMALAPITITQTRADVIDFSKPYLDLGLSILMKIPTKPEKNIFGFVDPFSREVWLVSFAIMTTIAMISLILDKISPNGHYGSVLQSKLDDECDANETDDKLHGLTYMNLTNSMWFSIGALLQQGSDVLPRSISGRTVTAFWWAASMIIIATYTANLAAFLTFNRMKLGINSVEELASQVQVKYGTVLNSPAQEFFKDSILPSFNGMYQFMKARGTLVTTSHEGIKKVQQGNFAFIQDSFFLMREMHKAPCNVFTVGQVFAKFGYGLAFQKNSPYTTRFSLEILHLREKGVILSFENYWFRKRGDCVPDLSVLQPSTGQLSLDDMIGVLYCVYFGIALGFVVIVVEWCVASYWEVDPTDPEKPNSWRVAMRRRMGRIWKDLCNSWPKQLKRCKKGDKSNTITVYPAAELNNGQEDQEKPNNVAQGHGRENKGYKQTDNMHPFQITE